MKQEKKEEKEKEKTDDEVKKKNKRGRRKKLQRAALDSMMGDTIRRGDARSSARTVRHA